MANLFDAANAPLIEPESITVGDFVQWKRSDVVSNYPTATHNMVFFARVSQGGASEIQVTATKTDSYYLFTIPSQVSGGFIPGHYHWQLHVTEIASNNEITIDTGEFDLFPDLDENATDPRTHAEILVAKIESLLEGKADSDVAQYSVAGRQLTKMNFRDLIDARDYYRKEIATGKAKDRAKKGLGTIATIKVKF